MILKRTDIGQLISLADTSVRHQLIATDARSVTTARILWHWEHNKQTALHATCVLRSRAYVQEWKCSCRHHVETLAAAHQEWLMTSAASSPMTSQKIRPSDINSWEKLSLVCFFNLLTSLSVTFTYSVTCTAENITEDKTELDISNPLFKIFYT